MTCSTIVIDGIEDKDMLVSVATRPKISSPEYDFESTYIDGRDGSVNRLQYIKDVEQTIEFNILEDFNIKSQLRFVKAWLFNAKKYYFKDDFVYRKVKRVEIDDIENDIAEYGKFDVKFYCDPFEYIVADQTIKVTDSEMIINKGTYKSLPRIKILGKGKGTITVNDTVVALDLPEENIIIDSDVQEIYKDDTNYGLSMTGEFPELKPKDNLILVNGDFDTIEIQMRERYL